MIAVVGCDGAGKSTLTADLLARLRDDHPTELIYLGQSSGAIGDWVCGLPLIGAAAARYLRRRSERVHAEGEEKPGSPDMLAALVIYLLSRWRHHKFRRMLALSRRGVTVLADRYPQAEVQGFYFDGPGLAATGAKGFVRWLAARELRLYARMAGCVPALVIRLNIDADTAHARKPDHRLSMLRAKAGVMPTLHFNRAHILDLDARSPYPEVLQAAFFAAHAAIVSPRGAAPSG